MGKVLIIKNANFAQNKIDTVEPTVAVVLRKSDFTILDGVFFSSANNKVAKNASIKLSEGYYLIPEACTITIEANSDKAAQVMLLSSIKSVSEYTNNEDLPVVDGQSKTILNGTTGTLVASGQCYLCVAEWNTVNIYMWPDTVSYLAE